MSEKLININLNIADRSYRLKITPDEEENLRRSAKAIKEKIVDLRQDYHSQDKQDYLAMTALMLGVDYFKQSDSDQEMEAIKNQLSKLNAQIDSALQ